MKAPMDYMLLAETALLAGEIMLVSGAEIYRVEDTVGRMLGTSGLERAEVFVVKTGIIITLSDPQIKPISLVRRVPEKSTNLGNISETNEISRQFCGGSISLEEAYERIQAIRGKQRYPRWFLNLCMILTTGFFCIILGGSAADCLLSLMNGVFIVLWTEALGKLQAKSFFLNLMGPLFIALFSTVAAGIGSPYVNAEPMIAGSIMPLLPGVAITNAIRDTLQGDYVSGGARIIEAFVVALAIAVGIGVGLALGGLVMGGIGL